MTEGAASVLIVEDHPVVRRGIAELVGERHRLLGSADAVQPAIDLILEREPDLVVIDVKIPGGGGHAVIEAVRKRSPSVKFLALSVSASRQDVLRMFDAGVDGYLLKTSDEHEVLEAIDEVLAGGRRVSSDIAGFLLDIDDDISEASGIERLTPREREVTTLMAKGRTYRETAAELDISPKTLETHMGSIFSKLGIASRHELTRVAYDSGFVRPDDT